MRDVFIPDKTLALVGRKLGNWGSKLSHFLKKPSKIPSDFQIGWESLRWNRRAAWNGPFGSPGVGGNFSWFFWLLAMIRRGDFSCWWLVPWCWRWRYWQGSGAIGKGTCHKFLWKIHHLRQDNPAEGALIMKGGLSWGRTSSWQLDVPMDCQGRFLTLMNKIGHQRQESNQVFRETGWEFCQSQGAIWFFRCRYRKYRYILICACMLIQWVYHYYMQKESLTGFHGKKRSRPACFLCRYAIQWETMSSDTQEKVPFWCNKRRNMEDLFSKLLLQVWCQDLTRFCYIVECAISIRHFSGGCGFFGIRGSLMPECKALEMVSWLLSSLFGTWVWILVIECLFLNAGYSWNNCLNKSLVAKKGFWDEEMVYQIRLPGEETSERDFGKKNTVWIVVPPNHPF